MHQYPLVKDGKPATAGWSELALTNGLAERHIQLVKLKERLCAEFLPLWEQRRNGHTGLEVEMLKSAVRALIRYSLQAEGFTVELARRLISLESRWSDYYLTPPYLIFHLPHDTFEAGSIHLDTIRECGGMFTCWTPINQRQLSYPALTFFEGSHVRLRRVAYKAFRKLRMKRWLADESFLALTGSTKADVLPKQCCSYFWDSNLLHVGNLNPDEQLHCAVVYRICRIPAYYEPANRCSEIAARQAAGGRNLDLAQLLPTLETVVELATSAPELLDCSDAARHWVSNVRDFKMRMESTLAKHCSFAAALIGQRFDGQVFSPAFYLLSYILGKENLVGLERFFTACANIGVIEHYLKLFDACEASNTFQEQVLLAKIRSGSRQPIAELDSRHRLLTWLN